MAAETTSPSATLASTETSAKIGAKTLSWPTVAGRRLEALLAPSRPVAPGSLIGIEHEYVVRRAETVVDFHQLIHHLPVPGRRLDPGDVNAYRLPCGLALTCDEGEAEVATPPIAVQPGFGAEVEAWARHGRSQLERILPPAHELEGYSTHLSAAMPGIDGDEVARLYARTFAPALALLLERPESQGVYVRPRPGRLELCGEFVEGSRLGAVAAFVAGSARAAAFAVMGSGPVPPALEMTTLPAVERYGLRVTRHACGIDLYAEGRAARLSLSSGGAISAQAHLEVAWRIARGALGEQAAALDLATLDRIVAGSLPLGVEPGGREASPAPAGRPPSSPLGEVTRRWQRAGFGLEAVVATWDFTVFRVDGPRSSVHLCIPRESLAGFVARLDSGHLDGALRAALDAPSAHPSLTSSRQTGQSGVFSGMADPVDLLPAERDPEYGQAKSERGGRPGKAGGIPSGRAGKSLSRPWKFLAPVRPQPAAPLLPPGPEAGASGETAFAPPPAPPPPIVPPPPLAAEPPPPAESPSAPPPPVPGPGPSASSGGGGLPWLLVAAIGALAVAGSVIAGAIVVNSGGSDSAGTPTVGAPHTETAAPTRPPTSTPTALTATATATPRNDAAVASPSPTSTPSPTATKTDGAAVATSTPGSTATPRATETPAPTATPTRFATETPRPPFTPTATPTRTATRAPTATPTPLPIVLPVPTTVKSTCTPVPGATCPP